MLLYWLCFIFLLNILDLQILIHTHIPTLVGVTNSQGADHAGQDDHQECPSRHVYTASVSCSRAHVDCRASNQWPCVASLHINYSNFVVWMMQEPGVSSSFFTWFIYQSQWLKKFCCGIAKSRQFCTLWLSSKSQVRHLAHKIFASMLYLLIAWFSLFYLSCVSCPSAWSFACLSSRNRSIKSNSHDAASMSAIVVVVAHTNDARGLCLLPRHGDSAHADMVTSAVGNAPVTNRTDLA